MRFFLILLICVLLVAAGLRFARSENDSSKRFVVAYQQAEGLNTMRVLEDTQTGAQYFYYKYGNGASMIKLDTKAQSKTEK